LTDGRALHPAVLGAFNPPGQALPQFDVVSTTGIIQDISPKVADLFAVLEMAANTTKPLVILISDESLFDPGLDLLEQLHGDLADKPFVILFQSGHSPDLNEGTSDKMLAAIGAGYPLFARTMGWLGCPRRSPRPGRWRSSTPSCWRGWSSANW
jgi:trimethylamine--corrinoid protein Co-methyltransferase